MGRNICDLVKQWFLDLVPKAQTKKTRTDKLDFIKIKKLCASKETWRGNPGNVRNYLKIIKLVRNQHPKYMRNSYNSGTKEQTN